MIFRFIEAFDQIKFHKFKHLNEKKIYNENKNIFSNRSSFLAFTFSACSFSTANVSELKFGKNDTAKPAATSFNAGETVFAVATVSNAMGKHKLKFSLKYDKR